MVYAEVGAVQQVSPSLSFLCMAGWFCTAPGWGQHRGCVVGTQRKDSPNFNCCFLLETQWGTALATCLCFPCATRDQHIHLGCAPSH